MPATVLIVDDEKHTRDGLRLALEEDYDVYTAANADEAFNWLGSEAFDVVLTDLRMGGTSGMKVIERAIAQPHKPIVIMMTAYGNVETAVEAMKRGAFDFLTKPVNLEKLEILIQRALKSRNLEEENTRLHARLDKRYQFGGIIGHSEALKSVIERVKLVAPSRATILLTGETGTGKELIAQALHQNSDRSRGPFMAVHAAALPANLLESELFGHEKGAFTGASERRIGRFEGADGGTLFLDEIGEIDASIQIKLLRFLETRSFERLGSLKSVQVDVRLVAATNRDLEEMVHEGDFREDLYYRLNVVSIRLPALRERPEDVPPLLAHYLRASAEENGLPVPEIDAEALELLQHYRWPGNIRELRNLAENLVVLKRGSRIGCQDLEPRFWGEERFGPPLSGGATARPGRGTLSVEENEKRLLRNALAQSRGNRTQAAELLGISRRTLHRKLNRWPELDVAGGAAAGGGAEDGTLPGR